MRTIGAFVLSASLLTSSAFAAVDTTAPLPAGRPAGVKEAAFLGPNVLLILLSAGLIIGGLSLAISNNGNTGITTPSTTTSSTTTSTTTTSP